MPSSLRRARTCIVLYLGCAVALACSSASSKRRVVPERDAGDVGKGDSSTTRDARGDAGPDAAAPVSCTVTVTGHVTYAGPCRIFVCSPAGSSPSVDLIANFGDAGDDTINFIGNSAIVGNYDQTSYPGGWSSIARQRGLDIRNYSGSVLPSGASLSAVLTSVTLSTNPQDVCAGVVTGTVTGDIVVIGDSGTSHSAHFEFVMK